MADERKQRLSLNEALFRAANERMKSWDERHEEAETEPYHCECSDLECREMLALRAADYERVRADSSHFFVAPGHQVAEVEDVVETHDDWLLVEKEQSVQAIVEATDPRTT